MNRGLLLMLLSLAVSITPDRTLGQSASMASASMAGQSFGEYEIKAGFIYKFISFVSWPEDTPDSGAITIAILGRNPFGDAFKSIDGSTAGGRTVKVKYLGSNTDYNNLKNFQILFISASEKTRLQAVLEAVENSPVLTIGDVDGFIDKGGMIGFIRKEGNQIGIEINDDAAHKARLSIRSMLKRIAVRIIYNPDHPKSGGIQ